MTINASGQVLLGGTTAGQSVTYELGNLYNGTNNDPSGYLPAQAIINYDRSDVRRLANRATAGSSVGASNLRGTGARQSFQLYTVGSNVRAEPGAGITPTTFTRLGISWGLTYVNASFGANSIEFDLWSSSALSTIDWAAKWKIIRVSDSQVITAYTSSGSAQVWNSQQVVTNPYFGQGYIQSIYWNTNPYIFTTGVDYAIVFN